MIYNQQSNSNSVQILFKSVSICVICGEHIKMILNI